MEAQKFFEFGGGGSRRRRTFRLLTFRLMGEPLPELSRKVESIGRSHLGEQLVEASGRQGLLHAFCSLRRNAIREHIHGSGAQLLIFCGCRQNLLAGALVKSNGVQFISSNTPPAMDNSIS